MAPASLPGIFENFEKFEIFEIFKGLKGNRCFQNLRGRPVLDPPPHWNLENIEILKIQLSLWRELNLWKFYMAILKLSWSQVVAKFKPNGTQSGPKQDPKACEQKNAFGESRTGSFILL